MQFVFLSPKSLTSTQAFPPKPFPKIPTKLLRDFSAKGPLYVVAATVHDVRRTRDIKKFDLLAPGLRKQVRHLGFLGSQLPDSRVFILRSLLYKFIVNIKFYKYISNPVTMSIAALSMQWNLLQSESERVPSKFWPSSS